MQDGTGSTTYQATYAYDPVGNRTGQTVNGAATSYSYNTLDQLTSSTAISGTTSYAYNGRGDLASVQAPGGTTTYTWDAADRRAGATLPDGTATSYGYDADGRRVSQAVTPSGGAATTTNYLWDEASAYGDVVAETDGGGNLTAGYTLGAAPCGCGGGGAFTGAVLAQTRGASTSYYLADGQGSTRALTDGGGNVTDTYRYDAYGDLLGRTGTTTNSYLYTGQQFDASTGLYDLRARYYNPATGLFLSKDSDLIDSRNPGALVENIGRCVRRLRAFAPATRTQ